MFRTALAIILISSFIVGCSSKSKEKTKTVSADSIPLTTIVYKDTLFDFGSIQEGDTVRHDFQFVNSGETPLKIINASSMCGCTIPHWPENRIMPGDSGLLTVAFSKKEELGQHERTVIVKANTSPQYTMLYIRANVKKSSVN